MFLLHQNREDYAAATAMTSVILSRSLFGQSVFQKGKRKKVTRLGPDAWVGSMGGALARRLLPVAASIFGTNWRRRLVVRFASLHRGMME